MVLYDYLTSAWTALGAVLHPPRFQVALTAFAPEELAKEGRAIITRLSEM